MKNLLGQTGAAKNIKITVGLLVLAWVYPWRAAKKFGMLLGAAKPHAGEAVLIGRTRRRGKPSREKGVVHI